MMNEPPYPKHETVTFALAHPDWLSHLPRADCRIEEPHLWSECGLFKRNWTDAATLAGIALALWLAGVWLERRKP